MNTTAKKSLTRFLDTRNGQRAVAAFVGVRSTDPAARMQAADVALHWCPSVRNWSLGDLIAATLVIRPSGLYAAKEVTL